MGLACPFSLYLVNWAPKQKPAATWFIDNFFIGLTVKSLTLWKLLSGHWALGLVQGSPKWEGGPPVLQEQTRLRNPK